MALFTVRIETVEETHTISYNSVDECLHDPGLEALLQNGATARLCFAYGGRLTRDVSTWEALQEQVINNSATLLRGNLA